MNNKNVFLKFDWSKFNIKSNFTGLKGFVFGFVSSVTLITGVVYAWNATWHGTSWIQAGKVVESEKIAENFEWLKKRVDELEARIANNVTNNTALNIDSTGIIPEGGEITFNQSIKFIDLKGGSYSEEAAPHSAYILRTSNNAIKFVMFNWNAYQIKEFNINDGDEECYGICVKLDNEIVITHPGNFNGNMIYAAFK